MLKKLNSNFQHKSVLLDEIAGFLSPKPLGIYVDATVGSGGHAERILEESAPSGRLIGIDVDPLMLDIAKKRLGRFGERCSLIEGNYIELQEILNKLGINEIDGIIFDLGVSTEHFLDSHRGFSIAKDGPLDMRLSPRIIITAGEIINRWAPNELIEILYKYGEERWAKRIVKYIVEERRRKKIDTTGELAEIIIRAVGGRRGKIHPATKTFQALRIAVNDELNNIETVMPIAVNTLKIGGRICVISFHSLEDRIIKNIFRSLAGSGLRIITKKPVVPKREEIIANPRARSAKLRVAEKM